VQSPKGAASVILALISLSLFCAPVRAGTTNIANLLPSISLPSASSNSVWTDIEQVGVDAWTDLGSLDWSEGMVASPFAIYIANGDFGGGVAFENADTNSLVHAGFFVGALQEKQTNPNGTTSKSWNFYDGGLTVSVGANTSVPLLGTVRAEAVAGPVFNLNTGTVYQQEFANFSKDWQVSNRFDIAAFAGTGYLSKYQDQMAYLFGLRFTILWG
jgi:hypothetical protein